MREWIPTTQSAKGRLVMAALEAFGAQGYGEVGVGALAAAAGVTTGSLYHHFGSKEGLYTTVRADVERRVLDRMEGAAAGRSDEPVPAQARAAVMVGFDYATSRGFVHLLAEPPRAGAADPIETLLVRLLGDPLGRLVLAAWRTALSVSVTDERVAEARVALATLLP